MCEVREERRVSKVVMRSVAVVVRVAIFMYAARSSGERDGVCLPALAAFEAPFWAFPWVVVRLAGCPGMVCMMALRAI